MSTSSSSRRNGLLLFAIVIFVGMLAVSWFNHGTGVIQNDASRSIYIPKQLTMPLQVQAAYNGEKIFFRYRWPAQQPSIQHDVLKFEGGKWVVKGRAMPGPQTDRLHEDRVAMFVDDGHVPEFARYGGYITIGDGINTFTRHASAKDVKEHPYLGKERKQEEVTKSLPETRSDINDWSSTVSKEKMAAQRKAGYFLDLWHWRSHRANPINMSDDQYVHDIRGGDKGKSGVFTNWDNDKKQPRFMFDPAKSKGIVANKWDDVATNKLGFDDPYYLTEADALPFDPNHAWKEGDTLPRRVLRRGDGSIVDIKVAGQGRWKDGYWDVTLSRAMDTGNPEDDKIFRENGSYTLAFSVHRDATGGRWHYVSLPISLGLDRGATIRATKFTGDVPQWGNDWTNVTLFYPGQVSWPLVNSSKHAGADKVRQGVPVRVRHSEVQLAHYGVEMEFNNEIITQWRYSLFAGVLLVISFGIVLLVLVPRNKE